VGPFLVLAHKPGVSDNVSRENCRQLPLDTLLGQVPVSADAYMWNYTSRG
jgi:hypothetical protein